VAHTLMLVHGRANTFGGGDPIARLPTDVLLLVMEKCAKQEQK
jgi:hypothetical protein